MDPPAMRTLKFLDDMISLIRAKWRARTAGQKALEAGHRQYWDVVLKWVHYILWSLARPFASGDHPETSIRAVSGFSRYYVS